MTTEQNSSRAGAGQANALKHGRAYATKTGQTVYFFSAPDPEIDEHGGSVSLKFGRRLWLWTTSQHMFDGDRNWRHELTHTPASSRQHSQEQP